MNSEILTFPAALLAGGIASISGFGIGSVLTPLLAGFLGTKLAVAVVSVPHFAGTALRLAMVHRHIDRKVLLSFGIASAAGGLTGALLHVWVRSSVLGHMLGGLLILAAVTSLTDLARRVPLGHAGGWIAGFLSGVFGGLVGNQGGIRSAALLGFQVSKESFIATATASAILVDLFRMPIYAFTQHREMVSEWQPMLLATAGVVIGTLAGKPLLEGISERAYRIVIPCLLLALGIWMLLHPGA